MQSIANKIISRIYGHGRGWSFSQIDFADLGGMDAVAKTLSRLASKGTIRRIARGVYDYPRYSRVLSKNLPPEMASVADAIARKFRWQIVPDGSTSLHVLGLDTQVPAQYVFLSSGPNREYVITDRSLSFRHQKTAHTTIDDAFAATLVQAIGFLGKDGMTPTGRHHLASLLSPHQFKKIVRDTRGVTSWIHSEIKLIAAAAVSNGEEE